MTSIAYARAASVQPRKSAIHRIALFIVWLAMATSGIVFSEPAPVDLLFLIMIGLIPMAGLARMDRALVLYLACWLVICACGFLSAIQAYELRVANVHIAITLFLAIASFVLAAFICDRPERHVRLVTSGLIFAGFLTAATAVIGIFSLVPGAYDLFTKWSRATGTFKDPNVYGAFLVPVIVLVIDRMMSARPLRAVLLAGLGLFLMLALVLSLSRGAFMSLLVTGAVYFYMRFVTAVRTRERMKLGLMLLAGAGLLAVVVAAAFSFEKVGALAASRIGLQEYDVSEEGRFKGQEIAIRVIIENPFGIGPLQFAPKRHRDSPHNVYISMFLHSGWIGGGLFLLLNILTLVMGFRFSFVRTPVQGIFIASFASFVGVAGEGIIIDTDHWRHLFILMALIWGLSASQLYRTGRGAPA